jgi:Raf kinase inhibitor-like YbhB/YbcL family protein
MKITSLSFKNNDYMPAAYSCDGAGIHPPLTFVAVPKEAKSLVLIVDDPDAPMGTFVHWVVYNIPPSTGMVAEGKGIPGSVSGKNSTGSTVFIAACPPSGTHRYFFKLYALGSELNLHAGAFKQEVEKAMEGHIIAQAELVGLYKRK